MKKIQVQKQLYDDPQIDDKDIPRLIERAEELYQQAMARNKQISSKEMIDIAKEIDIPKPYIQQAISEYQTKEKNESAKKTTNLKKEWIVIGLLFIIVAIILLRPQPPVQINNQVIINNPVEKNHIATKIAKPTTTTEVSKNKPIQPETTQERKEPPPTSPEQKLTTPKDVLDTWYLVSYFANDAGDLFEVPIAKTPIELRETWHFTEDRFRHIMDKSLSFSGKFSLHPPLPLFTKQKLINGTQYLLVGENVRSSIPSIKREFDYYHIEITNKQLLVFYLGTSKEISDLPPQAHLFERDPI